MVEECKPNSWAIGAHFSEHEKYINKNMKTTNYGEQTIFTCVRSTSTCAMHSGDERLKLVIIKN